MTKEVSKQIEETVEAVEEVKDAATQAVAEKESEVKIEGIEVKKSLGEKAADFIAKYRKPALRALTVTGLSALAYSIYKAAKDSGQEHVLEGDFDTFRNDDDEE